MGSLPFSNYLNDITKINKSQKQGERNFKNARTGGRDKCFYLLSFS